MLSMDTEDQRLLALALLDEISKQPPEPVEFWEALLALIDGEYVAVDDQDCDKRATR